MNTELRKKKAKNDLEKEFFKLRIIQFLENCGKCEKTCRYKTCKHRKKLHGLRTKLSYHKDFYRKFINYRNEKKTQIMRNKHVYLGL